MTVSSSVNRNDFAGNGSTTNFAVSFRFLQNSDVKATLRDALSNETLQVETTDYTLTGAGAAGGGTLVMLIAPPTGTTLTIQRDVPATQETDYVENDEFPAESHEDALDKLTMLVQQQIEDSTRHMGFSDTVSDATGSVVELSQDSTQRADKFLGFDSAGNLVTKTATDLTALDQDQQDKRFGPLFATVVAMIAANPVSIDGVVVNLVAGMTVETQGYTTAGDPGKAVYLMKTSGDFGGTPDEKGDHTAANGLIFVLLHGSPINGIEGAKYGVIPDLGVSDLGSFLGAALDAAKGSNVYLPKGVIRITQPIDSLATISALGMVVGAGPAKFSHFGNNLAALGTEDFTSFGDKCTVIKTDGCNFVGTPDTVGSMNAADLDKVKGAKNLFIWGVNGSKMGIYISRPKDQIWDEMTFADQERYGIAVRSGITTRFSNMGFRNCGWNQAQSGLPFNSGASPSTARWEYDSGCAIKLIASLTAEQYFGVEAANRPTTMNFIDIYIAPNNAFVNSGSGIRGIQAQGLQSGSFVNVGSYTSSMFSVCTETTLVNCHHEIFSINGLVDGDATPIDGIYSVDNSIAVADSRVNLTEEKNNVGGISQDSVFIRNGKVSNGNITTKVISESTSIQTNWPAIQHQPNPGATSTVTFTGIMRGGFSGMLTITNTLEASFSNSGTALWFISKNGAQTDANQLASNNGSAGGFANQITNVTFSGDDLIIEFTWGASWAGTEDFKAQVGLLGQDILNV